MAQRGFWDDVPAASSLARRRRRTADVIDTLQVTESMLDDAWLVMDLWGDEDAVVLFEHLRHSIDERLHMLLAHARCQDRWGHDAVWVMLCGHGDALRWLVLLYTRFAQCMGWSCQQIEGQPNIGGSNQVSLLIEGPQALAYFIEEVGHHRLEHWGTCSTVEVRMVGAYELVSLADEDIDVRHYHSRAPNCAGARCGVQLMHRPTGASVMWMGRRMSCRPVELGALLCAKVVAHSRSCDEIRREVSSDRWVEYPARDVPWEMSSQWVCLAQDGQLDAVRHRLWWRSMLRGDYGEMDLNEIR